MRRQRAPHHLQYGGILLLTLIMLVVFVVISAAALRLIARQSNQTILQEQEEQAFEIADAGVNYTMWLLSGTGGNQTPLQLVASPPPSTRNHPVTDSNSNPIGKFDLFFGPACNTSLEFRSVGYDAIKTNLCQVVDAHVQQFASGEFKLIKWNHLVGYPCNQSYVPPSPSACPTGSVAPTATPSPATSMLPSPTPSCNPAQCPSGWQCGTNGCEPNSCDDLSSCSSGYVACPADHERVSYCVAGYETFRDWDCCTECNDDLAKLCGLTQGGYCEPTYYQEACDDSSTPPGSCFINGASCQSDGQCCAGLYCQGTVGDMHCAPPGTGEPDQPGAPPGSCTPHAGICQVNGDCCAGLSCIGSGEEKRCSPGACVPAELGCGNNTAACCGGLSCTNGRCQ